MGPGVHRDDSVKEFSLAGSSLTSLLPLWEKVARSAG
jgi:hypothetical protein